MTDSDDGSALVLHEEPQRRIGMWGALKYLCYLLCPPFPGCIVSKMAFHPPHRGEFYVLTTESEREIRSLSEVKGERIFIRPNSQDPLYRQKMALMRRLKATTLRTRRKETIVVAYVRPLKGIRVNSEVVVLFSQPNSSDLGMFMHPGGVTFPLLADLLHADVYTYDYSGFGYSTGSPSERNIYADIDAVYKYIRAEQPNKKIVLVGFSMGTAASTDCAAQQPDGLAGLVLISAFTSGLRLLRDQPTRGGSIMCDRFRSVEKISNVRVPVLIIHGTHDAMIPHEHAQALHAACQNAEPLKLINGASHANILGPCFLETTIVIWTFLMKLESNIQKLASASSTSPRKIFSTDRTP